MSKNDFIPDAQTSAYARGFKDGWDAALKSLDKTYVPGEGSDGPPEPPPEPSLPL